MLCSVWDTAKAEEIFEHQELNATFYNVIALWQMKATLDFLQK
jgi:hypothetical protein